MAGSFPNYHLNYKRINVLLQFVGKLYYCYCYHYLLIMVLSLLLNCRRDRAS